VWAADAIAGETWRNCPGLNAWSAAELVAHLVVVERGVITNVDRLTQKSPIPVPFLKRFPAAVACGSVQHIDFGIRNGSGKLRRKFPESCSKFST
jgi:hypothetical protein